MAPKNKKEREREKVANQKKKKEEKESFVFVCLCVTCDKTGTERALKIFKERGWSAQTKKWITQIITIRMPQVKA